MVNSQNKLLYNYPQSLTNALSKRILLAEMPSERFAGIEGVEAPAYRPKCTAAKTLQSGVQKLRCHVMKEPLHVDRSPLKYHLSLISLLKYTSP